MQYFVKQMKAKPRLYIYFVVLVLGHSMGSTSMLVAGSLRPEVSTCSIRNPLFSKLLLINFTIFFGKSVSVDMDPDPCLHFDRSIDKTVFILVSRYF